MQILLSSQLLYDLIFILNQLNVKKMIYLEFNQSVVICIISWITRAAAAIPEVDNVDIIAPMITLVFTLKYRYIDIYRYMSIYVNTSIIVRCIHRLYY